MRTFRLTLSIAILALQAAGIVRARFVEDRYFAWAPYDAITLYEISVVVGGRSLEPQEVADRYRLRSGRDNRSPRHVIDIVRQYESTYGADDRAQVTVEYTVNGGAVQRWTSPSP